jgi:hypothetical protein
MPDRPIRDEAAIRCRGRLHLTTHDATTGHLAAERHVDNLIVTSGIALLCQALNYALVLAENPGWGNPYSPPVGAMYGAVGTSATAAVAGQTALLSEIGRAQVTNSAVGSNTLSYDFFFPTGIGNGTLSEVGVLGAAAFLVPTLTASLNSGSTYTALTVGGVIGTIPTGSTLILGYGSGTKQSVTTTAPVAVGAASIPVASFTAAATFASGTTVAYVPGILIDRAVLAVPVVKTGAQTMTLNLSLTLASA